MSTTLADPPSTELRTGSDANQRHTLWGLEPAQLHARFWAARGIQVVRQGQRSEVVPHAELYLLADPRTMCLFRISDVIEQLAWLDCEVMFVRINESRDHGYREMVVTDHQGKFVKFRRDYGGGDKRLARVAFTTEIDVARLWQSCTDAREGWKMLRRRIPQRERWTMSVKGSVYDRKNSAELAKFVRDLVQTWREPSATIAGISEIADGVWGPAGATLPPGERYHGRLWIGAGRELPQGVAPVGPGVLWDSPEARPVPADIQWLELQPTEMPVFHRPAPKAELSLLAKRAFDIVFSLIALACTLPLYPFIMAAIYLNNPGPIFFSHTRQGKGGKEFPCHKFRSMRTDAEEIKKKIMAMNKADGPQFFIEKDPRVTSVGRILRKTQLDEIPQFWNVLKGQMSIVGPRPSPHSENQYCPPWREARLSVKPGVTGLWQVKRTRATGSDFQEWIKYDIEYVERQSFMLDMWIIWRTIVLTIKGVMKS